MEKLVCPECGHNTFTVREDRVVDVHITVERQEAFGNGYCSEFDTGEESVVDSEREGDTFDCDDCGESFYDHDQLVTEDAYNADQEDEGC